MGTVVNLGAASLSLIFYHGSSVDNKWFCGLAFCSTSLRLMVMSVFLHLGQQPLHVHKPSSSSPSSFTSSVINTDCFLLRFIDYPVYTKMFYASMIILATKTCSRSERVITPHWVWRLPVALCNSIHEIVKSWTEAWSEEAMARVLVMFTQPQKEVTVC